MANDTAQVIAGSPAARMVNKNVKKGTTTFQTIFRKNNVLEIEYTQTERERRLKHERSSNCEKRYSTHDNQVT